MAKLLSRSGRTSTPLLCPLGRWALVLVISPWTTAGVGGIGKKSWEWVWTTRVSLHSAETETAGDLLLRSLLKALAMKDKHTAVIKKFDAILPPDLVREWATMISQWELDKTKPNPYAHTEKGVYYFIVFRLLC